MCHASAFSNSWIFYLELVFGTSGEFCMCAAHQTDSSTGSDVLLCPPHYLELLHSLKLLLSFWVEKKKQTTKGINTLKQGNKINEQEVIKKKEIWFCRRKWQSLWREKNQVMYSGELSKVFDIPSHNTWSWRHMVWITLLYRNVEFLGKPPVDKLWVIHWDW